jgi:hypothetical protein
MASGACPVCEEALSQPNTANCHGCQHDFHLQVRMDIEGKDCGFVWLHEERMHLVFACNNCLAAGLFPGMEPAQSPSGA